MRPLHDTSLESVKSSVVTVIDDQWSIVALRHSDVMFKKQNATAAAARIGNSSHRTITQEEHDRDNNDNGDEAHTTYVLKERTNK